MALDAEETSIGTHAILVTPTGTILLQQRTAALGIPNPGKISMFGGTIKQSEDPRIGLQRELLEELELNTERQVVEKLGTYYKTKELDGIDFTVHVYLIKNVDLNHLNLHEGAGIVEGSLDDLLQNPLLTRITKIALEDCRAKNK